MVKAESTASEVSLASVDDLRAILKWLEEEFEAEGQGFWNNRGSIERAYQKGELWVIRRQGQAVAFQARDEEPRLISVKRNHRRHGLGSALIVAMIKRAQAAGTPVLFDECATEEGLALCLKHGFERHYKAYEQNKVFVRLWLPPLRVELSSHLPKVSVVISFYPEAALYKKAESVPSDMDSVTGVRLKCGEVILEQRVVGLSTGEIENDLVVKIEIDGAQVYFGKAKYGDEAGVEKYDQHVFLIRRIPAQTARKAFQLIEV